MKSAARTGYLACLLIAGSLLGSVVGCRCQPESCRDGSLGYYEQMAVGIEYPDASLGPRRDIVSALPPRTLRTGPPESYWNLTLLEAIRIALENSQVMRDIGGTVVRAPAAVS